MPGQLWANMTNILVFLDKITEWVDQGEVVDVVFLDFAKAFDKVPHQRLLLKVASLGIGGKLFDWIQKLVAKPYTESLYKWHCVYLEANQLLKDSQHGFRTGRSCLTNILVFFG